MEKKKHPKGCFFHVPPHWGGIEISRIHIMKKRKMTIFDYPEYLPNSIDKEENKMNFTKKRNIIIEFIKNIKDTLIIVLGFPCLIVIPYLYALALGYNTNVLSDVVSVWTIGIFLIVAGAAIISILINIKVAKITCRLPLTEKEMDELTKNRTCEEILINMQNFLTYTVFGEEYCVYKDYKYRESLKPFYLYIKHNYLTSDFREGYAFMEDLDYLMTREFKCYRF